MKSIITKHIFIDIMALTVFILFNNTFIAQELKLSKRKMTNDEFVKYKSFVGTYKEGQNYNKIIKGHGTGLMPPTEEQWEEMKNLPILIDKIEYPLRKPSIPVSYDNSTSIWFPPIGNQGGEGSCVSWACVYYVKSFQEAKEHNWDLSGCSWEGSHLGQPSTPYQDRIFSPDFVFHQINHGSNNGSTYSDNMNLLKNIGCCTWNKMPNDPDNHTSWPAENAWRQAPLYRSQTGRNIMFVTTNDGIADLKQLLFNGNLAVISINAHNFSNLSSGDLWTLDNYNLTETNHANTIVGYDDNFGPFPESGNSNTYGAFKVANSWGVGWGEHVPDGFYYISYECMKQRIQMVSFYQNYFDYKPKMLSVFEMTGCLRNENIIDFGIGVPNSPASFKNFCLYNGGNVPFPNNPMAIDITEFIPYMSGITDQFFMSVHEENATTSGIIQYFSIEMFDDYENAILENAYISTETPKSTQPFNTVNTNIFTSSESIYLTYPKGGEIFSIGSNPIITYNSKGTSGYINIDYSTDGGTTWNSIANNIIENGQYTNWTIPNTSSTNCKIRISDSDGNPSSISRGLFTIDQFIEQTSISLIGIRSGSTEWGDYNNDGNLDILLTGDPGIGGPISKIYHNNGNNTFTEQLSLPGIKYCSINWGDYDNDDDLDILLTGDSGISGLLSKIYRNDGNNTFTEQITLTGVKNGSAAWGDYDNDGDIDILLIGDSGIGGRVTKIYRNDGNNTFTEQITLTGVKNGSAAWGDYDNDGDIDILLTGDIGVEEPISYIYRNNGDNTFTEQTSIVLTGIVWGSVAWGDYDNDGYLDILLSGSITLEDYVPVAKIYRNNGNNTFTEQKAITLVGGWRSIVNWGDYDNDGNLDILSTGWAGEHSVTKIYRNNEDNTFTDQTSPSLAVAVGAYAGSVKWGDYDNDHDLDILLTADTGTEVPVTKIYQNTTTTPNTPPSPPSNLKAVVNGSNVIFSWDKSSDNETPQNGLTYNLVIGTNLGACDILSPVSDINTGKRKIVSMGNAGHCNSKIIKGLPSGKYYWSVQSIDNNFSGSSFAPTQSFIVQEPQTIKLTNPESGDTLIAGSISNITYTSIGNSGYINLYYSIDGGITWDTIATNAEDNGEWQNWVIPNRPSSECKIRISDVDGFPSSVSGLFSIVSDEFSEQTFISLPGIFMGSSTWGDYDNDGDLDILLTGSTLDPNNEFLAKIFQNNGNNTFTEQKSISLTPVGYCSAAWGDYDNDGNLDILLTGNGYKSSSKIYHNNGNNTFTEQTSPVQHTLVGGKTGWIDYDNDGNLDIFAAEDKLIIYKNNGAGVFIEQVLIKKDSCTFYSATWGDYDNDGDKDVSLLGTKDGGETNTTSSVIYRNNGDNTFTEIQIGPGGGENAWGDYDNDGDLDILICEGHSSILYRNNGDNIFTGLVLFEGHWGTSTWGDYDNDGNLDILLTGTQSTELGKARVSKIYRNNGDNTFTEQNLISLTGVVLSSTAFGDYDNDGDLDILLAGDSGSGLISKIYRNNYIEPNIIPSVPSNLKVLVDENVVTFRWDKSNDKETPQNGLTYNLVVGSTPDGVDIVSPMSDIYTGYRKIVGLGNTNLNNFWIIKNLPDSKYYWSVQAIDNCFSGSEFAKRQSFIVSSTAKNIEFKITLPNCDSSQTPLVIEEGNFSEGLTMKFPEYIIPSQYSTFQPYYNSLVNSELYFSQGSLNENIKIEFILKGLCENGLIDNPETEEIVEVLYLSFNIIGDSSGVHNPLEYYYLNDDKEAYLRIPISNIDSLMELLNYDMDLLFPFFTENGMNPDFEGIRKEVDENYYTIYFKHLSEIKLGVISSPTTIANMSNSIPTQYRLEQNYPNPFNPITKVRFGIPKESKVNLTVYNVLGEQVIQLVDEYLKAGYHEVELNISNYSSGIYFYRIQAGDYVESKKMILLK